MTDEHNMVNTVVKETVKGEFTNYPLKRKSNSKRRLWDHLSVGISLAISMSYFNAFLEHKQLSGHKKA